MAMTNAPDIAQWLMDEIKAKGRTRSYQNALVRKLREKFGDEWVYKNHNGNMAIDRRVLSALKPLKTPNVLWERSDQSWRIVDDDELARLQEREALRQERLAERARLRAEWEASRNG